MTRRQAGPSITAVTASTVTTAESLPAYLESPLLYSFPTRTHIYNVINNDHNLYKRKTRERKRKDIQTSARKKEVFSL